MTDSLPDEKVLECNQVCSIRGLFDGSFLGHRNMCCSHGVMCDVYISVFLNCLYTILSFVPDVLYQQNKYTNKNNI